MSERLKIIERLAKKAGQIALQMRPDISTSLKDDGSFVTEADLAIQDFLFTELSRYFPDAVLLGEENCCATTNFGPDDSVFVIDPIDGTDCYRSGFAYFCVSIGCYEKGRFTLGVIYLPVFKDLYSVDRPGVPLLNGSTIRVCNDCEITRNSFLAAPSNFHKNFITDFPGKIRSMGSTAFHLALAASGGCVGAIPTAFIWDIAAGVALVEAAGGKFARFSGEPLDYDRYMDGSRLPPDLLGAPDALFDLITSSTRIQ